MSHLQESVYASLPVFAQNWMCTAAGWQRYRQRFGGPFREVLAGLEATGNAPITDLHALQLGRLATLCERARKHTRHYRELPAVVEHPDPGEALARTLERIPPLEKESYRNDPEAFLASDLDPKRLLHGKTSGTTGTALPLWYTPQALAEEYATVWRMRRGFGVPDPAEPNLTFNGQVIVPVRRERPPFWRTNACGHQTLFSLYHMAEQNLPAYIDAIHATPATFVQGYPSSIHLVARAMLDAGRPLPESRIKAVFTSSESLLAFQREAIEAAFGAPVRDRYGVSEFVVSMVECGRGNLHVDMEFGIVEVEVADEDDATVTGPLLVTGLAQDAAPMIRYRIGDVGTRSKRPCPCGRPGEVFLDVDGRIEDYVVTPDDRLIGRMDHIFKEQLDVAEAQILQEDKGSLEVLLVPRPSFDSNSERRLLKEFRARVGDRMEIQLRRVEEIPREANGKFRAVKSNVGRLER